MYLLNVIPYLEVDCVVGSDSVDFHIYQQKGLRL